MNLRDNPYLQTNQDRIAFLEASKAYIELNPRGERRKGEAGYIARREDGWCVGIWDGHRYEDAQDFVGATLDEALDFAYQVTRDALRMAV